MDTRPVAQLLSRFWWIILLRGVFAILFGIVAFVWPSLTLVSLTLLFAMYVFADGVFEVLHAIGHRKEIENWGMLLLEGTFSILLGLIAFGAPELTTAIGTIIVAFYIATWSIVTGAMRISMAVRLRKEIDGEWLLGFSGLVSILLGLVVLVRPAIGALGLLYFVAAMAVVLGMTLIAFAIKVRMFAIRVRQAAQSMRE